MFEDGFRLVVHFILLNNLKKETFNNDDITTIVSFFTIIGCKENSAQKMPDLFGDLFSHEYIPWKIFGETSIRMFFLNVENVCQISRGCSR